MIVLITGECVLTHGSPGFLVLCNTNLQYFCNSWDTKAFQFLKKIFVFFLVKKLRGNAALNPLARLAFQHLSGLSAALSPPYDVVVVAAKSMGACLRQSLIWTRDFGHLLWEGRRNRRVSGETQCLEQRWRAVIMAFETENKHASRWTARDGSKKRIVSTAVIRA